MTDFVLMTDGKHVRMVHYGDGPMGGYAWMRAPWGKVRNYAANGLIARANLVKRIQKMGWWYYA